MNQQTGFAIPEAAQSATDLTLTHLQGTAKLTPSSIVLCINRGPSPQIDTFDGHHVTIPSGYFDTEYGAALHFQRRLIVPGTRNLEIGGYVSWIGILGSTDGKIKVDRPEDCEPFDRDELQKFGEKVEAIDRTAMHGADADVKLLKTSNARASMIGTGKRTGVQFDASQQASDAAAEAASHVHEPAEESATREAFAEAQAEGHQIQGTASLASVRARVRR